MFPEKDYQLVFLAYLDDAGKGNIKVLGGIIVPDVAFERFEMSAALIALRLVPESERDTFTRFHASDLFAGEGAFKGLDENTRHAALMQLLAVPQRLGLPFIYSAVDRAAQSKAPIRSASWMDIAFFMCAAEIDACVTSAMPHGAGHTVKNWQMTGQDFRLLPVGGPGGPIPIPRPLSVIIVEDPESKREKELIRASFRQMREQWTKTVTKLEGVIGAVAVRLNRLSTPIDEVFFGMSSDSIGLQVADACCWAMGRRLNKGIDDEFFQLLMRGWVRPAKQEPDWSRYRHFLKSHEDVS